MTTTKFLRVVRLDQSDTQIYELAAEAGEWAIPGTFYFWDVDPDALSGKSRQAFVHGFLGLTSFGWATLVTVAEIDAQELSAAIRRLAGHLVERFGAPDIVTAMPAAREEIDFAVGLCNQDLDTLIAIQRTYQADEITENFKIVRPASGVDHSRIKLFGLDDSYDAEG